MPQEDHFARVVFTSEVNERHVISALEDSGWIKSPQKPEADEKLLVKPGTDAEITIVDDQFIVVLYAFITGGSRNEVASMLASKFSVIECMDEVKEFYKATSTTKKLTHLYNAGVTLSSKEKEAGIQLIKDALQDPDPDIRIAALLATGYSAWPEWEAILREFISQESDERLREEAELALETLAENIQTVDQSK